MVSISVGYLRDCHRLLYLLLVTFPPGSWASLISLALAVCRLHTHAHLFLSPHSCTSCLLQGFLEGHRGRWRLRVVLPCFLCILQVVFRCAGFSRPLWIDASRREQDHSSLFCWKTGSITVLMCFNRWFYPNISKLRVAELCSSRYDIQESSSIVLKDVMNSTDVPTVPLYFFVCSAFAVVVGGAVVVAPVVVVVAAWLLRLLLLWLLLLWRLWRQLLLLWPLWPQWRRLQRLLWRLRLLLSLFLLLLLLLLRFMRLQEFQLSRSKLPGSRKQRTTNGPWVHTQVGL